MSADDDMIASCCHQVLQCLFTEMLERRKVPVPEDCEISYYYHLLLQYEPGLVLYCREVSLIEGTYFDSIKNPLGYHRLTWEKVKLCCEKTKLVYEALTGDRTESRWRSLI